MRVVVFAGPTLTAEEIRGVLDAEVRPPASQGDVFRLARERPWGIGLIDGTFDREPAVWHKELLWAMSRGVHVYGSASMGALRAAELAAYGMVGVGEIFRAFMAGQLEGDDEVAVAHAGAEHGFRQSSEALVNVRATLRQAVAEGLTDQADVERLLALAADIWYPERTWSGLLDAARAEGVGPELCARLERWLPRGRVDQKRLDALAMLAEMATHRRTRPEPLTVRWRMEHTLAWDNMTRSGSRRAAQAGDVAGAWRAQADELRLLGVDAYESAVRGAMLRGLAELEAHRFRADPGPEQRQDAADALRRELGLRDPEETRRWLDERGLDAETFGRFAAREAIFRWMWAMNDPLVAENLADELRRWPQDLARRATDKQRLLAERGLDAPRLSDCDLDEAALLAWWRASRPGVCGPEEPAALALRLGLSDREALVDLLLREWWFERLSAGPARNRRS